MHARENSLVGPRGGEESVESGGAIGEKCFRSGDGRVSFQAGEVWRQRSTAVCEEVATLHSSIKWLIEEGRTSSNRLLDFRP